MATSRLDNYLRSARRRTALSQDEVAFLLGTQSGSKVSRYERGVREPGIDAAFAFEIIYLEALRELYAGRFDRLERVIAKRAKLLAERLREKRSSKTIARKIDLLSEISARAMARES
jgi:transcriptional regulator with XRE-family HTH domain